MTRRELGAAVSVMWVIVLLVLLLGAGFYIYSVQGEIQNFKQERDAAVRARQEFEDQRAEAIQKHIALSELVGFRDAAVPGSTSSDAAIRQRLEDLRGRFPNDMAPSDDTLELVAERLVAAAEKHDRLAKDRESQFTSETAKRQEIETARTQIETSMNEQLARLTGDLRDERERAQSQKETDDTRYDELQSQADSLNARIREVETEAGQQKASLAREMDQFKGRVAELSSKVKLIGVDEAPLEPDGSVVSASQPTGLIFLDLGSDDLLRVGVKFDVYRFGKGGVRIPKGIVEVREVHPEYSVAGVVEQFDARDPINAGDVVANPLFSRAREKVFALVGEFPVYGRSFLERRLRDLGAEVEPEVNSRVDFVVLGEAAVGEDAPELSELPGYKRAQELGIQFLRFSDLDRFLRP